MPSGDARGDEPLLEVVVVTYRSWDQAEVELSTMAGLARDGVPGVHWTFVDNGEGHRDAAEIDALAGAATDLTILRLENPGFAGGCNEAVARTSAPWVMMLNPDVLIDHNQLSTLVERVRAGDEDTTYAVSMVTHGRPLAGVALAGGSWFVDAPVPATRTVLGPSGGAGIYPRERFLAVGGFWPDFFAWGEDADLAWRLHRAGVPCEVIDLRLPHQGGHSAEVDVRSRRRKVGLLYRNRAWVAKRNLSPVTYPVFMAAYALATVAMSLRNARRGCLVASWRGYGHGLLSARRVARV